MVTKDNIAIIIPFHKNVEMLRLSIHTLEESIKVLQKEKGQKTEAER